MAHQADIKAGLEIKAGVSGLENIQKLNTGIKDTAGESSKLAREAQSLAQAWQTAQSNHALIQHYKALKNALAGNRSEIQQTQQQMRQLSAQMADNPTRAQQKEYRQLAARLNELNAQKRNLSQTLRQTSADMKSAGIAVKQLAQAEQRFAAQAADAEQKLHALNREAQKLQQTAQARTVLGLDVDNGIKQKIEQITQAYLRLKQDGTVSSQELAKAGAAYRAELAKLAEQSDEAKAHLAQLDKEAQKLQQTAQARAVLGLDVDDRAREEIKQLDRAFAELKRNGGLSQAELARAAELHRQKVGGLEASLGRVKPKLTDIAQSVSGIIGKAGGLAYVAREAVEFEAAMGKVKKVTDGTPEQMAKLSAEVKQLAGELGIMPAELAGIAAAGGQMGVQMDRLPEFTRMAAQMSRAFGISADQAGDMAAKISNVFGLQLEQMGELGDAINTLGNTTAAKEAEIADVLTRIGGNAKQFGLAAEEAAALGAAFVSLGKTPEVAGTAINALLSKLQTAQVQGDKFQNALAKIGLSADQMAANIAANPQAALTDFLQRLEQVDKQSRAIMLAEMFGAEYSDDLALLTGSLKTYADTLATATDKAQTFGAMQKEAAAAGDTVQGKMDNARAAISATAISLGETLTPVLKAAADAVGGAAKGIQVLTEQFPLLTQLAVGIAAAKVAVSAYGQVIKLVGRDAVRAMDDTDQSVKRVRGSLKGAAADAKLFGMAMKNADGSSTRLGKVKDALGGIGGQLTGLAEKAGQLGAALTAGFAIGEAAYQNFEWVRTVGDELGRLVAYAEAILPWTERTLKDVGEFYKTSKEMAKETAELQKQAAEASKKRAEAEKKAAAEQAAQIQVLQAKHRQLRQEYQALTGSMETLKQAGKENTAMYRDLAQQQTELGIKVQATGAQLAKLNARIGDTGPLADSKKALEALGLTAEEVASGIGGTARAALDDFGKAAAQFGNDAEQMQRIFQAALSKMGDSPEAINALKDKLAEVGRQAGLSADEIRKIGDTADSVAAAFDKIGVDSSAVLTGISREARQAFDDFTAAAKAAADSGIKDNRLLAASFEQMMAKLKSPQEFAAFKQQLQESGQAAKLTQEQLARLNTAAREGAAGAQTAYGRLAESVKKAGDTRAVQAAGQAAAAAMKRGEIGAEQYAQVLEAVKRRTEELKQKTAQAGDTAAQAHAKAAQAAQTQAAATETAAAAQKQQADAAEQNVQTVKRQTAALNDLGQAVDEVLRRNQAWKHLGTEAWPRLIRMTQDAVIGATRATRDLNAEMERGGDVAAALARAEGAAAQGLQRLDKTTLDNLNAAIDKARQKMQALSDEAKHTREDLQAALDELNGDKEASARLTQQRKVAELKKKQQTAVKSGNRQAADDYAESLRLQEQIWQRQQEKKAEEAAQRQREAEERARAEAERREQEARREAERERQEREREAERQRKETEAPRRPAEIADYLTGGLPEKIHIGNLDLSGVRQAVQQGFQTAAEQGAQQALNQLEKEIQDAQARSR